MTAKQAIKLRCKDCNPDSRDCDREDCLLYGLNKPKGGANRTKAIRDYCTWCLNGHRFGMCSSPDCPIYQYRMNPPTRAKKTESTVENPIIESEFDGSDEELE
jgi:hypothetical protein